MTAQELKDIVSTYVGKLENTTFSAINTLHYEHNETNDKTGKSEWVVEDKKVLCSIELTDYGLNAEEDTLAILGGVGGADASKENLIYYLDKYKFKHKEVEQLSLW